MLSSQRVLQFERSLRAAVETVPVFDKLQNSRTDLPEIVNVVATVAIFPPDSKMTHRFPLEAIASQIGGNVQYGPLNLPADILRLRDSISDSTALVFRSGKLVIVHCLSWEHSRFCCHYYRMLLESIECVMRDPSDDGRLKLTTLAGRTQFDNWQVHNSVGYGRLGCRVDLAALRAAAPHVCQYKPDAFPGLKLRVWIKPPSECMCEKLKCPCKVKMLIFDTGKIIIVGARSTRDVNSVFYRFKLLVPQFVEHGQQLPRNKRFEARMARLLGEGNLGVPLDNVSIATRGNIGKRRRRRQEEEEEDDEAGDDLEMLAMLKVLEQQQEPIDTNGSPFLKACVTGQLENVRWMLEMNRDHHLQERDPVTQKTALELLEAMELEEGGKGVYYDIMELLKATTV